MLRPLWWKRKSFHFSFGCVKIGVFFAFWWVGEVVLAWLKYGRSRLRACRHHRRKIVRSMNGAAVRSNLIRTQLYDSTRAVWGCRWWRSDCVFFSSLTLVGKFGEWRSRRMNVLHLVVIFCVFFLFLVVEFYLRVFRCFVVVLFLCHCNSKRNGNWKSIFDSRGLL